jgi:UDP:flavonoid glycosyltransferase YjiC (YdhE family)
LHLEQELYIKGYGFFKWSYSGLDWAIEKFLPSSIDKLRTEVYAVTGTVPVNVHTVTELLSILVDARAKELEKFLHDVSTRNVEEEGTER